MLQRFLELGPYWKLHEDEGSGIKCSATRLSRESHGHLDLNKID